MSVGYEVFEHLVIEDTQKHSVESGNIHYRLSLLAAWVLQNRGAVGNLTIIADGQKYSFYREILSEDYHTALNALYCAKTVEVMVDYSCSCRASETDLTPFELMQYLDQEIKEDSAYLEGLFYCVYYNADGNDAGYVSAYGKKNGVLYTGAVPFVETKSIPDGDWYAPQTAICCEFEATKGRDMAAIEAVCRELCKFSEADTLEFSDEWFSFFLNNFCIKTDAQLKEVIGLCARLIELTDGECGLIGELADISGPDVKILHFDVEANGEYTMQIAAVSE